MMPDDAAPDLSRILAGFERSFRESGNVLWVWRAISTCTRWARIWDHAAPSRPPAPQLPRWCLEYLGHCSTRLAFLDQGLDEKETPRRSSFSSDEDFDAAFRAWRQNPTLGNKQIPSRVPWAFGFAQDGWNAYDDDERRDSDLELSLEYDDLVATGLSGAQARSVIMERHGYADDRNLRRRLMPFIKRASEPED